VGELIHKLNDCHLVKKDYSAWHYLIFDILFTFHESTITINRIYNMSRVIHVINVLNQSKMIPSQVHDDV